MEAILGLSVAKKIYTASPYRNDWPDGSIQSGTYFFRLEAGGKTYSGWVEVVK